MNLLDIIIISMMIFLVVKGIFRGFFREIGSLAGVILGIWLANHYQPQMTGYLKLYLPSITFLPLISFAVIFIFVLVLCNLSGWVLRLLFKKVFLGWLDRTLGAGLAIAKGVIIIYLAIILLTFYLPITTPLIAGSKMAQLITVSSQSMIRLISPEQYRNWKKKVMEKGKKMGEIVSEKAKDITKNDE
ncbi:MAG: CvpA family protein [Deltaproteobacteria bacterium]|nr:CvpA family protein [Deltaproteobacteria bacterium]